MVASLILGGSLLLGQEVRLRTPLAGGPISGVEPSGQADFRARGAAGDMRLNVEVENVNLPAGTQLDVFANGALVGKITVSGPPVRGGEMELNTRDGQTAPQLKAGDTIIVRGAAGVLLSGVVQARVLDASVPSTPPPATTPVNTNLGTNLRTNLAGGPLGGVQPSGHVDFRQRPDRGQTRLNVEVEDVRLPAGTKLNVEIGGRVVGQITLNALGGGELELDSLAGDLVSLIGAGEGVRILGPAGAILSGAVQPRATTPSTPPAAPSSAPASSNADNSRVRSPLTGGAIGGVLPDGHIDFRVRANGGSSQLNIEVEDVNLPQGTVLDVIVGGVAIGKITIGPPPMRGGELELNTRDGDILPAIKAGDVVTVRSATLGPVLSGVVQVQSFTTVPPLPKGSKDDPPGDDRGGATSGGSGSSGSGSSGSGSSGSGSGGSGSSSGSGSGGSGSSGSGSSGSGSSGSGSGGSGSSSGSGSGGSGSSGSGSSGSGSSGSGTGGSGSSSGSGSGGSGSSGSGSSGSGSGGSGSSSGSGSGGSGSSGSGSGKK